MKNANAQTTVAANSLINIANLVMVGIFVFHTKDLGFRPGYMWVNRFLNCLVLPEAPPLFDSYLDHQVLRLSTPWRVAGMKFDVESTQTATSSTQTGASGPTPTARRKTLAMTSLQSEPSAIEHLPDVDGRPSPHPARRMPRASLDRS